jgi:phosphoribosylanthranilate isomerase
VNEFFQSNGGKRAKAKICGITTAEDAQAIVSLGADAIGINFWPKSKRYISLEDSGGWLAELAGKVTRVGVFVNATMQELQAAFASGMLDALQLHGDESPDLVASLLEQGVPVFKALGGKNEEVLAEVRSYPGYCESILLDAYAPTQYGGTGETMDWALGHRVVFAEPGRKVVLAGGLVPDNVAKAIEQVRPFAVDVASGVESLPGKKDLRKVEEFLKAVRGVSSDQSGPSAGF